MKIKEEYLSVKKKKLKKYWLRKERRWSKRNIKEKRNKEKNKDNK
jgi:hypothetical protein